MVDVLGDTLNQLYTQNHQRVRSDISKLLARFPSLRPKEETFVTNEGDSYLLVSLVGTVPITFRANQYNIPLEIFVVKAYPDQAPLCFVRPTRGMEIRPRHKHVDSAGQCYTDYLSHWRPTRSDLLGAVADLQALFSSDPPVYSKPPSRTDSPASTIKSSTTPATVLSPPPVVARPPPVAQQIPPPTVYQPSMTFPPTFTNPAEKRKREVEERMHRKATDVWQAVSNDVSQFYLVQQRLVDGAAWLNHSMTTLSHDKRELEDCIRMAEEKEQELLKWLAANEGIELSVDDLVAPADPLSAQMLELTAEDAAIEDTLYYLDKALHGGNLNLETHLKLTRNLCREQFQKRALALRVLELQSRRT